MRKVLSVFVLMLLWSQLTQASWELQASDSTLRYGSVKNGSVYESNSFDGLKGYIGSHGLATLEIDLASVNTGISVRDTRMKTMFFDLAKFPAARMTMPVDVAQLSDMSVGEQWPLSTGGKLKLHGQEQMVLAELHIYRISEKRWLITSAEPIMVDSTQFGLSDGVEALRKIAGLDSILPKVPVSLQLVFEKL